MAIINILRYLILYYICELMKATIVYWVIAIIGIIFFAIIDSKIGLIAFAFFTVIYIVLVILYYLINWLDRD